MTCEHFPNPEPGDICPDCGAILARIGTPGLNGGTVYSYCWKHPASLPNLAQNNSTLQQLTKVQDLFTAIRAKLPKTALRDEFNVALSLLIAARCELSDLLSQVNVTQLQEQLDDLGLTLEDLNGAVPVIVDLRDGELV